MLLIYLLMVVKLTLMGGVFYEGNKWYCFMVVVQTFLLEIKKPLDSIRQGKWYMMF
jgi:hypothetical protein